MSVTITPPRNLTRRPRGRRRDRAETAAGQVGFMRGGPITYATLAVVAIVSVFPFYWTIVAASTSNADIARVPPPLLPGGNLASNIDKALTQVNMGKAILNSTIVSGSVALGTVLFCTLAGFAFAKLRFRGRNLLLLITIGTLMVPPQLGIIPLFMLIAKLHWVNQLQAVILPTLVSGFGVFFMRQYLSEALPIELLEAGRVDGASTFRIFWRIVLPIARPAMAVLGMLTFMQAWNDFFWPIIALTQDNPTVQVALLGLGQGYVPDQSIIMAGTLIGTLPLVAVFLLLGRQIVGGIMHGAIKG
jgi:cellobiose transport system permease protein